MIAISPFHFGINVVLKGQKNGINVFFRWYFYGINVFLHHLKTRKNVIAYA